MLITMQLHVKVAKCEIRIREERMKKSKWEEKMGSFPNLFSFTSTNPNILPTLLYYYNFFMLIILNTVFSIIIFIDIALEYF